MEKINPDVWQNSSFHRQIMASCQRILSKNRYLSGNFSRILLVSEPWKVVKDDRWFNSLRFVIDYHRKTGIELGILKGSNLPFKYGETFINFFMVPRKFVAIFEQATGLAFEIKWPKNKQILSHFTLLAELICSQLDENDGGFWIKNNYSLQEIKDQIIDRML
jgi:hypothetical protein